MKPAPLWMRALLLAISGGLMLALVWQLRTNSASWLLVGGGIALGLVASLGVYRLDRSPTARARSKKITMWIAGLSVPMVMVVGNFLEDLVASLPSGVKIAGLAFLVGFYTPMAFYVRVDAATDVPNGEG